MLLHSCYIPGFLNPITYGWDLHHWIQQILRFITIVEILWQPHNLWSYESLNSTVSLITFAWVKLCLAYQHGFGDYPMYHGVVCLWIFHVFYALYGSVVHVWNFCFNTVIIHEVLHWLGGWISPPVLILPYTGCSVSWDIFLTFVLARFSIPYDVDASVEARAWTKASKHVLDPFKFNLDNIKLLEHHELLRYVPWCNIPYLHPVSIHVHGPEMLLLSCQRLLGSVINLLIFNDSYCYFISCSKMVSA